jgi:hypothetical protein
MLASRSGNEFPGVSKDGDVFGDIDMIAESYNGPCGALWSYKAAGRDSVDDNAYCLGTDCEWHACLCLRRAGDLSDHSACRI